MQVYSIVLLVVAFISSLCTAYLIFNANKGLDPLYVLSSFILTVSNIGYYLLSDATTFEGAMLANAVAYLGGIFLPLILMIMLSSFSDTKLPRWFLAIITLINIGIYCMVLLSNRFLVYYSASNFVPDSYLKLVNSPGPGYYIRVVVLSVEVILSIFFTVITIMGKKKAYPVRRQQNELSSCPL